MSGERPTTIEMSLSTFDEAEHTIPYDVQEKIFDLLEPIMINAIEEINKSFEQSSFKSLQGLKIVVVGGYGVNQYLITKIPTSDIDARLVATDETFVENLKQNNTHYLKLLYLAKISAMNTFVNYMNLYVKSNPNILKKIKKKTGGKLELTDLESDSKLYFFQKLMRMEKVSEDIPVCEPNNFRYMDTTFTEQVDPHLFNDDNFCSYKLSACNYQYSVNGKRYISSLFDLVPFCNHDKPTYDVPSDIIELEPDDTSLINKWYNNFNFTYSREVYGYIPYLLNNININEIRPHFYVAGLGYMIWDLLYMINLALDSLSKLEKNSEEFHNTLLETKFNRYIKKYIFLLASLDKPELTIECNSLKTFVEGCS